MDPDEEGLTPKQRSVLPLVTSSMKWWLAVILGILFFLVSMPWLYRTTSMIKDPEECGRAPTLFSVLLHSVIFALIVRLLLW